jgi:hypothetical protein
VVACILAQFHQKKVVHQLNKLLKSDPSETAWMMPVIETCSKDLRKLAFEAHSEAGKGDDSAFHPRYLRCLSLVQITVTYSPEIVLCT